MSAAAPLPERPEPATRSTYHHGDLRRALLDAGLDLAREGGPDAVVLREATRRVGVSANAAYRHFSDRDALLDEVVSMAQSLAADTMADEVARQVEAVAGDGAHDAADESADEGERAQARLRAVGIGYLRFAMEQPGLFRAAFAVPTDLRRAASPDAAGLGGRTPYQLLGDALDAMLDSGVLPASQRPGAEALAWSTVHGLAMLTLEGPLRDLGPEFVAAIGPRLVEMVVVGLGLPDTTPT
ncbi:TetR/AcrR family transcriptional regulator [Terracoccus luteus]|uniref:AcrR family transcriptional regulator n=1 Tax=Terracoccus luteus TaxID=53356 RepID=A0A839PWY7_9MICO|nr:TetR/AcrR family transcriptional regulator [Terracoccus luteus]MBB2988037.1 AcrR family transcriptional regulator [Terracoccus luteus]MCP2173688.1 AcrR family transcriptional regulator [Terracoccus luteus]